MTTAQKSLNEDQLAAFYSDSFAMDQAKHFSSLVGSHPLPANKTAVDVGGGRGYFALQLRTRHNMKVRVVDMDRKAIEFCRSLSVDGIEAIHGDALAPPTCGDEGVACFNLMLHHLVANDEASTRDLQRKAISAWRGKVDYVFVNEYVYDSLVGNLSGRLIYEITNSKVLSLIGKMVGKVVPSLRANTFGVGVRFRAHEEWVELFRECGFEVVGRAYGNIERLQLPRRLLLIREKRRDSYLLKEMPGRKDTTGDGASGATGMEMARKLGSE